MKRITYTAIYSNGNCASLTGTWSSLSALLMFAHDKAGVEKLTIRRIERVPFTSPMGQ